MCRCDASPKRRMKDSVSDNDNIDEDHKRTAGASTLTSTLTSTSTSTSSSHTVTEEGETLTNETMANHAVHESQSFDTRRDSTVETILPSVVWLEHILPCLDRPSWNALMEASRKVLLLTATKHQGSGRAVAQPPWPTNRPFQSKSGGQGLVIESMTMSHDGEFLACGSVIGSIEIWNLRTGKISWKKTQLANEAAEERAQRPEYYASGRPSSMERRSTPIGSVLKFSAEGYVLACGFENRIFVWDLGKELVRRSRRRMNQRIRNLQQPGRLPSFHHGGSYAVPPQPQLRDDRSELSSGEAVEDPPQQKHPSLPLTENGLYASQRWKQDCLSRQQREEEYEREQEDLYQTLEIECDRRIIYEVTYLGFSKAFGNSPAGHKLIARYGKMAYIWTQKAVTPSSLAPGYVLTHRVHLTSSRCQMVSNPSLTALAVATNGAGSSSRRRNGEGGESTANKIADGKGIIHVWDLEDARCERHESNQFSNDHPQLRSIKTVTADCGTKIVAFRNHVVRGLEFLEVGGSAAAARDGDACLVSASLQGELKFWKKCLQEQKHPRDRYSNDGTNNCDTGHGIQENDDEDGEPRYVCVYRFQSPGKIFSMASWSNISSGDGDRDRQNGTLLLAAGEARGQIRVWKLSLDSLSSFSSHSKVSLGPSGKSERLPRGCDDDDGDKQQRLRECLSTEVGDHVHYDNIKLLAFTPNGKSLAVSRAYDAKIWFQPVWQS